MDPAEGCRDAEEGTGASPCRGKAEAAEAVCAATQANNTNFNAQEPLALFIALQIMQELLFLINTGC